MKYYLYLDDSNKFEKETDSFTFYSFILLNKEQRKKIEEFYLNNWINICMDSGHHDYDMAKFSRDEKLISLLKEIKGNDFIEKYNRSMDKKYKNVNLENHISNFIQVYDLSMLNGSIIWCKKCSTKADDNFKDYDRNINIESNTCY